MSAEGPTRTAKKACVRCSRSKKRCDRAFPRCGLCARLDQRCEYDIFRATYFGPQQPIAPRASLAPEAVPIKHLKDAVTRELEPFTPESILSAYRDSLEQWFPVAYNLQDRLRPIWEEVALDVALLCLSIRLVTMKPSLMLLSDGSYQFTNTYLQTKSCLALAEGLGLNSLPIVQSKILLTLFEVSHSFYPAAYISIATALRAAEALQLHPMDESLQRQCIKCVSSQEEMTYTWCGILVLDHHITILSSSHASLTRPRSQQLYDFIKPVLCPTHMPEQNTNSPLIRFGRAAEASSLLDKIHNTIFDPTSDHEFNNQEITLAVNTSISLTKLLNEEVPTQAPIYSGALFICYTAHLLVFENSTKFAASMTAPLHEDLFNITHLTQILPTVTNIVKPFITGRWPFDLNFFSPLSIFLVHKAAMLTTQRLALESNDDEGLQRLKILRKFLSIVSERWMSGKRYIELLDENTTPRLAKALSGE